MYRYSIFTLILLFGNVFSLAQNFDFKLDEVFSEIILNIPDLRLSQNPNSEDDYKNIREKRERFEDFPPIDEMEPYIDPPRVTVDDFGTARGRGMKSFSGRQIYAFQSIPYAKPPVDDLRFKMTEEYTDNWPKEIDGDYDASYLRAKCPQSSMFVSIPGGREDCLHLSIYTPMEINGTEYPVMFFIHGGAFYTGDANLYVPTHLLDDDVVVVVIQYRLGSLGFLSTGTIDAPGNMGLMDQITALRWVKKYIRNFGGDPDNLTVFGQSAGGASASWMQMTPQTRAEMNNGDPLFQKMITMSGSALEMWTLDPDPDTSFIKQVEHVDCYVEGDTEASLNCMMDASVVDIVNGFNQMTADDRYNGGLGFFGNCPIIQSQELQDDHPELIVIDQHPLRTVHQGEFLKVNTMAGSVRDEGSLVLGILYLSFLAKHNLQNNTFFMGVEAVPFFVNSFGIVDMTGAVANSMNLVYLKNAEMGDFADMSGGMVDMLGMLFLKTGSWSLTHLLQISNPDNPIYFYSYEFESDDSLYDWLFHCCQDDMDIEGGVTHTDDLLNLFYLPSLKDERERMMANRMTKLWTNFAKYGDPTPDDCPPEDSWEQWSDKWIPFTAETLNFMLIEDNITMQQDYKKRWNYNTIPDPVVQQHINQPDTRAASIDGNREHGFMIASGILGTLTGFLIVLSMFLLYKN